MTFAGYTSTPRRARVAVLAVSGVVAATGAVTVGFIAAPTAASASICQVGTPTVSSYASDASGSFGVPAGINRLHVVASGGKGGFASTGEGGGGYGATVTSDVTVTPSDTLTIDVGQSGGTGTAGGSGGTASGGTSTAYSGITGGGGGGASFVSDGATLLIATAGGGGAGFGDADSGGGNAAGVTLSEPAGTIYDGGNGQSTSEDGADGGVGGGGGTATPGAGGTAGVGFGPGTAGSGRVGGNGSLNAGGGAGGYAGGGGGGSGGFDGGGGAGSSYGIDAYTIVGNDGDGSVAISYEVPAITSTDTTTFTAQEAGSFTVCTTGVPTDTISELGTLPSGVTFTDNGDGNATLAGTPASGTAGSYPISITAANGNGSNAVQDFTLTVSPETPTVSVSPQPSGTTYGQSETFTATITGVPGGVAPTGLVDFESDGTSISGCDTAAVSTSAGVTTATCDTSALTVGSHTITADYLPGADPNYNSATGELDNFMVGQQTTSVGISSSLNPSDYGQSVTATATITPSDLAGSVQFTVNGNDVGSPVTVSSGSAQSPTLTDSGSPLSPTDNTVVAVFTPTDTTDYTTANNSFDQVVDKASTTTSLTVAPTTLTADVAAVAPGAGTATGTVTFSVDGSSVGTATLSGGTATLTYTVPSGHTDNVAAVYGGDDNFTGSSDSTSRSDPTIKATVKSAHPKTSFGWYRSAVTVHFSCKTHGAPLDSGCPAPVTLTKSAGGQSVTRTITATNGGTATVVVKPINIDRVKPSVSVGGVKDGAGYDGVAPKAICAAHDSLSGVRSCSVKKTSASSSGKDGEVVHYTATATDKAGNTARTHGSYRLLTFYVESVPFTTGAFDVKIGHNYTVGVVSKTQPRYYEAAPSRSGRSTPYVKGPLMTNDGHHVWTTKISITSLMRHYALWNIGAKTKGNLRVVEIRLS